MRLRFPNDARAPAPAPCQECTCRHCATCACGARPPAAPAAAALPPAPPHPPPHPLARADSKLTLTMKKEALDSSILASKSRKKSGSPLPDVETYRASRSKLRSSVKAVVSDASGVLPALLAARRRSRAAQVSSCV
ncbi:uncharacterized protein LOC110377441 isoform X2 [Helicoverpa armigera]|uniref:uncharacterized protein LOC110377441 isoform X2 n=1 Tax=Helicoverpa armigera TaxID=29058 RepID=UPI003082BD9C